MLQCKQSVVLLMLVAALLGEWYAPARVLRVCNIWVLYFNDIKPQKIDDYIARAI